jgi:hypothetical protein
MVHGVLRLEDLARGIVQGQLRIGRIDLLDVLWGRDEDIAGVWRQDLKGLGVRLIITLLDNGGSVNKESPGLVPALDVAADGEFGEEAGLDSVSVWPAIRGWHMLKPTNFDSAIRNPRMTKMTKVPIAATVIPFAEDQETSADPAMAAATGQGARLSLRTMMRKI